MKYSTAFVREESLQFAVELRRERLVVRQNERRQADVLDDVCHRHRLAGAGDAEEGLEPIAALETRGQLGDGLWLITRRLERRLKMKLGARHGSNIMLRVGVCSVRFGPVEVRFASRRRAHRPPRTEAADAGPCSG
jgi:hypothetical protein